MSNKENQVIFEKTWNKEQYLRERLNNRSRNFFISFSTLYLNIAAVLLIISFVLVLANGFVIYSNTKEKSYYVTGIDGKVYQVKINDDKYERMGQALDAYYSQKNKKGN